MAGYGLTRTCTIGSILDTVARAGGSTARVFRQADLSQRVVERPNGLIFLKDQFALLQAAAKEIGDPAVAARLSVEAGLKGLGSYGTLIAAQPALREALNVAITEISAALQTATTLRLSIEGRWASLTYDVTDRTVIGRQQNDILAIGYMLAIIRRFGGSSWVPRKVTVPGATLVSKSSIEQMFGCSLEHGETTSVCFPAEMLEWINRAPIEPRPLDPMPSGDSPLHEVEQAILSGLGNQRPSLNRTARRLGLAPRTLQRHLNDQGTTFQHVRDTALRAHAVSMIGEGDSMTDIAYALGFSDQSHFTRSFRRWTGRTPSAWRKTDIEPVPSGV